MARHPEIYRKAEWRKSRAYVINRTNGLCEQCLKEGRTEVGHEVDHIIELTNSNKHYWNIAYNPDNLQLLCVDHHNEKHGRSTGLHRFVGPI
ncbi:HNH endonuclease [Paenibacillus sp. N4]|uniref:HNH endonuclease n=1 Tax=Paenibacillus vietnamensis TaxID=2590547 RepID=UPI001CD181EE|nr:HNH endonuclease [Paenibacillus vietnamensis]